MPKPTTTNGKTEEKVNNKVTFHYLKSNLFRVIHVDGVHGGPSPRGQIQMGFFNERQPIPQQVTHELNEAGELGDEIMEERVGRRGIIREMEVELLMNLDTAKSLHKWLGERIEQTEKLVKGSAA